MSTIALRFDPERVGSFTELGGYRLYRIDEINLVEDMPGSDMPGSAGTVWFRRVRLDGKDWKRGGQGKHRCVTLAQLRAIAGVGDGDPRLPMWIPSSVAVQLVRLIEARLRGAGLSTVTEGNGS